MLDIRYVAGLIDADGSFAVCIGSRDITPRWIVNFRSIQKEIVEEVCKKMGCGKVYYSRRLKEGRMGIWSWQTVKLSHTLKAAKRLFPHLHVKKEVCGNFISTLEEWLSYPRKHRPKELLQKIVEQWATQNECQQTKTHRKAKEAKIIEFRTAAAS